MVLLAAFSTLLYRVTGTDDVVVGSPIANRTTTELISARRVLLQHDGTAIPARGNPSFREVCGRVKQTALGAYEHQELPFERVVELLNVPRDPGLQPGLPGQFPGPGRPAPAASPRRRGDAR